MRLKVKDLIESHYINTTQEIELVEYANSASVLYSGLLKDIPDVFLYYNVYLISCSYEMKLQLFILYFDRR